VWRLESLFGESLDERTKLLASMTRHNGSVLCVRWSATGLLASASDDTIILIWQLDS
jgi:WD40 repeat protein